MKPIAVSVGSAHDTAARGYSSLLRGRRVLVIDDNASAREILCAMLEQFGMRAEAAEGGEPGMQRLQHAAAGDVSRGHGILLEGGR